MDGRMYIVNHFLDVEIAPGIKVPDRLRVPRTNSKQSIQKQTKICKDFYWGRLPNFVLLDFVDQGDWNQGGAGKGGFVAEAGKAACGLLSKIGINC
jgi:hypothetical protein